MKTEYRVSVKRVGKDEPRHRVFKTRCGADRWLALLGPEPWKAFGREPDDRVCCGGDMCGCGGLTFKEQSDALRRQLPAVESIVVSVRSVSDWVEESRQMLLGGCGDCDPCLGGRADQCAVDPERLEPVKPF